MTNKVQIGLRVTEQIRQQLEKIAQQENRSVNNLVEYILIKYLEEADKDKQTPL